MSEDTVFTLWPNRAVLQKIPPILNTWYIATKRNDPDLQLISHSGDNQVKKALFFGVLRVAPVLFYISLFPATAYAGFFDSVAVLFGKTKEIYVEERPVNSQNMNLLQAATNQDPNPAKGGGDIAMVGGMALLSENGPSGTIADVEDNPGSDSISVYVVREGDSLSGIAKLFNVSVSTIVWANDISKGVIKPGQTLLILPISGVQHEIKKGDTLASLAKKYKADADEIARYNSLNSSSQLAIGDTIIIPDGMLAVAPTSSGVTNPTRGTGGPVYEGYYLRPVLGGRKTQGLHGYNGVDLGAPKGTPVLAAAGGQVIVSRNYGYNGGYGNYIVVSHPNGTQTLYSHLSKNLVFEGYTVAKGQVIGEVGSTGKSTGPHLHFEVRGAANPF